MRRYLAILGLFAVGAAHAQTFFDGFENYAADSGDYSFIGGWSRYKFNDEELNSPLVRTARDGITPYEGTKMLEMRNSIYSGGQRVFSPFPFDLPHMPAVWARTRFAIAASTFVGQQVAIGVSIDQAEGTHLINFDPVIGQATYYGRIPIKTNVPISLGSWHTVDLTSDFKSRSVRAWFDGVYVGSQEIDQFADPIFRQVVLAVSNKDQLQFDRLTGSPGAFFDSVSVTVVPEPPGCQALALSVCILLMRRARIPR